MNKLKFTALCLLFIASVIFSDQATAQPVYDSEMVSVGIEGFSVMRQFFDYDKNIPLNAETIERLEKPGYVREKIVFKGAH